MPRPSTLVINAGSSSLKFGLYTELDGEESLSLEGTADRVGGHGGKLELRDSQHRVFRSEKRTFASHGDALDHAIRWLTDLSPTKPAAIGHRVVHGGPRLTSHQRITPAVLADLKACVHFAPLHVPVALELIREATRLYPDIPQFACFDTAFHSTLPERAARFAIPQKFYAEGVRRYGFHGLSYESVVHQLSQSSGDKLPRRSIVAHLGSGASLVALKEGKSVDTSMGMTPTGGIPMATRSGDLDPGVLLFLLRTQKLDADALEILLNQESGLAALSGGKSDMRELEAAADGGNKDALLAINIFCMAIRKQIAAYVAELGGLDLLVFTGGIGENSSRIRNEVCDGLQFLGAFPVQIIPSQEDLQIARHCRALDSRLSTPSASNPETTSNSSSSILS